MLCQAFGALSGFKHPLHILPEVDAVAGIAGKSPDVNKIFVNGKSWVVYPVCLWTLLVLVYGKTL